MEENKEPVTKAGRPLKYRTVEQLQTEIDKYFTLCDQKKTPYTITGLALAVDMSRQGLINYEDRAEFFDALKRAKLRVENSYEISLRERGNAGDIFGLKNFGWTDKQETVLTGANGGPIQTLEVTSAMLKVLTMEQLEQIRSIAMSKTNEVIDVEPDVPALPVASRGEDAD